MAASTALRPGEAAADGLDEVVPDSALVFVSVRDAGELRQKQKALPLWQLRRRPDIPLLGDTVTDAVADLLEDPALAPGVIPSRLSPFTLSRTLRRMNFLEWGVRTSLEEVLEVATGQAAAMVSVGAGGSGPPWSWAAVAEVAGAHDQALAWLQRTRREAREAGAAERFHRVAGQTIIEVVSAPEPQTAPVLDDETLRLVEQALEQEDIPADFREQVLRDLSRPLPAQLSAPCSTYYCLTDRCLVLAGSLELAQELVAGLMQEPSGGLAAQPDYRAVRRALDPKADLFVFVNTSALLGRLEERARRDPDAAVLKRLVEALGGGAVRAVGLTAQIEGPNLSLSGYLYAPGRPEGLRAALPTSPGTHTPAALVPADALAYLWCNLDFPAFRRVLEGAEAAPPIPGETPEGAPPTAAPRLDGPLFDVLRPHLSRGLTCYVRLPDRVGGPAEETPPGFEAVVSLAVEDGRGLERTIERLRLLRRPPFDRLEVSEFRGRRFYLLRPPEPPGGPLAPRPQPQEEEAEPTAFAVLIGDPGGDRVIMTRGEEALRGALSRSAAGRSALAESERFRRAAGTLPSDSFLLAYLDLRAGFGALGRYVRRRGRRPPWAWPFTVVARLAGISLDANTFPSDEALLPYLDTLLLTGTEEEAGLLLRCVISAPGDARGPSAR